MRIQKRNGEYQPISFDKVSHRIINLANDAELGVITGVDCDIISQKVIRGIVDGISSKELDVLASEICISMSADNPDYGVLASRIAVSNLHKSTPKTFSEAVKILQEEDIVNKDFSKIVAENSQILDEHIVNSRDYLFDLFGFKTLEKGYLLKVLKGDSKTIIERPQYMWMRVAVALHMGDIDKVLETYEHLSLKNFIHASPTLFNAGTKHQQLSSCFLISDSSDSVKGIFKTMGDVAQISKHGGGIGLTCSYVRSEGSIIRGTNNRSDGIMPMLKVYNEISRYINQGQRKGSIACFLEPHHADIEIFLEMKKNTGDVNLRARDLFYGLWVSDLFMKCVEADKEWYLMCPDECPGLVDAYGDAYETLYMSYVEKGLYRKKIQAREIWNSIIVSQIETGLPYMCYKDAVNKKSNQENIGTINSSNLCVAPETMILTSKGYYKIKDLKDKDVEVWNGEKFSKTTVRQTGTNQELIKVNISGNNMLECTPYHKFHVVTSEGKTQKTDAKDLKPGMLLLNCKMPYLSIDANNYFHPLKLLESLIEIKEGNVQISYSDLGDLKNMRYMMNTFGCNPQITTVNNTYNMTLSDDDCMTLLGLGLEFPDITSFTQKNVEREYLTIENIEKTGRISDTYCFNEPERNMGIFNGILTGNCVEIMLNHNNDEYAVCNISTISLGNCVKNGEFNFELLGKLSKIATINLNKVIDINYYPTTETMKSNTNHRPIAIGVQGLYDAFVKLRYPFTSPEAKVLNKKIFECIQYHALKTSCELAKVDGTYSSFDGSPSSKGMFQHNMWGIDEGKLNYDWESLRKDVKKYGLRNSLVTALPPTASTANILGNTSSFETVTTNIFTRSITAGNFMIVNNYLVNDLKNIGMWSEEMKDEIISAGGSIQNIDGIPEDLKLLYKTTWETSQKETITMSADRAPFIDHSQSLNIFMAIPTASKLSSAHFHGWKLGLKTGSYYIRSLPSSTAEMITVSKKKEIKEVIACSIDNKEACVMCEG
jgi:ribonucleotide reductase alpha subunit